MTPPPDILAAGVRKIAAALGLSDCRIASLTGPAPHAAEFQAWLDNGHQGTMAWLEKNPDRRKDPREVLTGAKSIIVVALNYFHEPRTEAGTCPADQSLPAHGTIAQYAHGDDYHGLLDQKLTDLCHYMETQGGTQKLYADTGPILERDWASAAGLGWNGKSTIQIHPRLGNYFFLAEILTTLELTPDPPMADHCGKCIRCITACPTAAIIAPRQLDARRCLSYLTIENKGPIPIEFRRALGSRIYGCDDCLAACPWNRFAKASTEAAFAARPFVHHWPLRDFLTLTDATFLALFRHSPIRRIKRPAFLRNVCTALGNIGTREDLPALQIAAEDPDELIAEHAAWAIQEIQSRQRDSFEEIPDGVYR